MIDQLNLAILVLVENGKSVKHLRLKGAAQMYRVAGRKGCYAEGVVSLARCYPEWKERLRAANMRYGIYLRLERLLDAGSCWEDSYAVARGNLWLDLDWKDNACE
jgi:hypothetical protein